MEGVDIEMQESVTFGFQRPSEKCVHLHIDFSTDAANLVFEDSDLEVTAASRISTLRVEMP
jgi:hypothetical protein